MKNLAEVITAISGLAWPMLAAIFAFKFYEPIKKLLESVQGRKFTIKVGDNELSVEEASEQQRKITSDIQSKLAQIEGQLEKSSEFKLTHTDRNTTQSKRILWVDDKPRNNSFLIANLQEQGHVVETALSTDQSLSQLRAKHYDVVISDMGRPEGNKAGIDLIVKMKKQNINIPIFIFCSGWSAKNLREEAINAGAAEITNSGTTLLSLLTFNKS